MEILRHDISNFTYESIIGSVNKLLICAGVYKGKFYGSFVRDVVVPRLFDNKLKPKFKKIKIWFETHENADKFMINYGAYLKLDNTIRYNNFNKQISKNQKTNYFLFEHDTKIVRINIIVSPKFPTNKLHIDNLIYYFEGTDLKSKSLGNYSVESLVDSIIKKEAIISTEYIKILKETKNHNDRSKFLFLAKDGWTFSYLKPFSVNSLSHFN